MLSFSITIAVSFETLTHTDASCLMFETPMSAESILRTADIAWESTLLPSRQAQVNFFVTVSVEPSRVASSLGVGDVGVAPYLSPSSLADRELIAN